MFEGLLRRDLDAHGVPVEVSSAGLLDWDEPADPQAVEVMALYGVDISSHRSRPITAVDLAAVDLVLGMTREHAREVVLAHPDLHRRTFTAKDFERRSSGSVAAEPGADFRQRVAAISEGRTNASLMGSAEEDDIADPHGQSRRHFETTAESMDRLSREISETLSVMIRAGRS